MIKNHCNVPIKKIKYNPEDKVITWFCSVCQRQFFQPLPKKRTPEGYKKSHGRKR